VTRIYVDTDVLQELARATRADVGELAGIDVDLWQLSARTLPVAGMAAIVVARWPAVQARTTRTAAGLAASAGGLTANALEVSAGEAAGAAAVWVGAALRPFPDFAWSAAQNAARGEIAKLSTPGGAIHLLDQGWHGIKALVLVPVRRGGIPGYRYGPGWGKALGGLISSKQLQKVGTFIEDADQVVGKVTHVVDKAKALIADVQFAEHVAAGELAAEHGLDLTIEQRIARVVVVIAAAMAAREVAGVVEDAIKEIFKEAGGEAGSLIAPGVGTVIGGLVGMEVGSLVVKQYGPEIEKFFQDMSRGAASKLFHSHPEIFGVG
jgi:hypothetical protein